MTEDVHARVREARQTLAESELLLGATDADSETAAPFLDHAVQELARLGQQTDAAAMLAARIASELTGADESLETARTSLARIDHSSLDPVDAVAVAEMGIRVHSTAELVRRASSVATTAAEHLYSASHTASLARSYITTSAAGRMPGPNPVSLTNYDLGAATSDGQHLLHLLEAAEAGARRSVSEAEAVTETMEQRAQGRHESPAAVSGSVIAFTYPSP